MNIYVGNLSPEVTEGELKVAFQSFGQVNSVNILHDKFTGEPRGFGFVEIPSKTQALAAISGLNGKDIRGQKITVNEARPRSGKGSKDRDR